MRMVIFMRVIGEKIRLRALASLLIALVLNMKDFGWTIYNTAKVSRPGVPLENHKQHSWDCSSKERKMEREDSNGKMAHTTRETLSMDPFKDRADITLLTWTSTTRESSGRITWREGELKHGLMEEDTKETLKMARKMGKALSNGLQVLSISEVGRVVNNMV